MVNLEKSETFSSKFMMLGTTSQDYLIIQLHRIWLNFLDINATGEEEITIVQESILGSDKSYTAIYSRSDDSIYLDII